MKLFSVSNNFLFLRKKLPIDIKTNVYMATIFKDKGTLSVTDLS